MAKIKERRKAIFLRSQGKSYGEILNSINVSKSSLSLWLRDMPLGEKQILRIKDIRKRAVERYRQTMRLKREKRNKEYYITQKKKWLPLTKTELFIAGLFLYWGEGNKTSRNDISINNTDPKVVKFAAHWLINSLGFPKEKIRVFLHLYKDMDIESEIKFWSKELKIPKRQFSRPYIKDSFRADLDQKGYGHGTCGVRVSNTVVKENILMAIEAISDHFGEKSANI